MPRTANIRDDVNLPNNEVQKYPCIYDKADPGHKEKDRVINGWKEVDNSTCLMFNCNIPVFLKKTK